MMNIKYFPMLKSIRFDRLFNNKIKYRYLNDVHKETKNWILEK